jgi:putative membrane protein
MAMGVANIIPGVSGGTIAVVFGIYEDLMEALSNFLTDKQNRWQYIKFLALIFGGALISILSLARLLSWSFEHYPLPTVYFFLGLIIGSIPVVFKSHSDMQVKPTRIISFLFGFLLVVILALLQDSSGESASVSQMSQLGLFNYLYFIFCGAVAASAMIVPGVSGSFILILLGVYWQVLDALSGLTSSLFSTGLTAEMVARLSILSSLAIGVVIGILVFARLMNWALKKHAAVTMYLIIGLIIGSIYQIYPGYEISVQGSASVLTFIIGIIISLKFGVEKNES